MLAMLCAIAAPLAPAATAEDKPDVLVIVGAPGEEEYVASFTAAAEAWRKAAEAGGARCTVLSAIDSDVAIEAAANDGADDRDRVKSWIDSLAADQLEPVWIAYVGHGTFDNREARLNLRGPDVSATELQAWLAAVRRPLVFVHGGSASGPFLPALSGPGRVIITGTESGEEVNYARFGEKFAAAIADPGADLDGDGQTTALEAYLIAARRVQDFYTEELRMATEHALIDDNGDKRGTPPDWFRGTRATKRAEGGASPDGVHAHRIALVPSAAERALTPEQRATRNQLEDELEVLRSRKDTLPERDYLRALEAVLRKISAIYRSLPAEPESTPPVPAADETPHAVRAPDS
jgi:hypothetical protein